MTGKTHSRGIRRRMGLGVAVALLSPMALFGIGALGTGSGIADATPMFTATATVSPLHYKGSNCPHEFTFNGAIKATGLTVTTTVRYRWIRSDGGVETQHPKLVFTHSGSKAAMDITWTLGTSGKSYAKYWEKIQILSPKAGLSNPATFTLTCT